MTSICFRLRLLEPKWDPRLLAASAFENLESHGPEQGHQAAAQRFLTAQKRSGERPELSTTSSGHLEESV